MPAQLKNVLSRPLLSVVAIPEIPPTSQISRAKDQISEMFFGIAPKEPNFEDLVIVYSALLKKFKEDGNFNGISKRDVRLAPWIFLMDIDPSRLRLALNREVFAAYIEYLQLSRYHRAILVLAHVFLRKYPREENYFGPLRSSLNKMIGQLNNYRGLKFRDQSNKYHFFGDDGPATIAKEMVNSGQHPEIFLSSIGLKGGCLQEGIVEYVFEKWLANTFQILSNNKFNDYQERIMLFLDYSIKEGTFKFPRYKSRIAESMLLPFENKQPESECKDILQKFLLKNYGDPRFDLSRWVGVSDRAIKIFRGWFVQDTLEDFFSLLDYVARYDHDADRQWKYRKSFWGTCLRHGIITDAWVALGKTAWANSHHFLRDKQRNYGSIGGSGVMPKHSVLIMDIGGMTITEWSHSGKYRFWHDGNEHKPKMYKKNYFRNDVVNYSDFEGIHYAALSGKWQGEAADLIFKHTGFRLNSREYMQI